jgi:hypothetical protein
MTEGAAAPAAAAPAVFGPVGKTCGQQQRVSAWQVHAIPGFVGLHSRHNSSCWNGVELN